MGEELGVTVRNRTVPAGSPQAVQGWARTGSLTWARPGSLQMEKLRLAEGKKHCQGHTTSPCGPPNSLRDPKAQFNFSI